METIVEVDDLTVAYRRGRGFGAVVHNVSFTIARGEVLGLVGESGCGKSTIGLQLLGYRHPQAKIVSGRVLFKGADILTRPRHALDKLRGDRIGFVPQNPTTALNPGIRVGDQLSETLLLHARAADMPGARARTIELFDLVGLPKPAAMLDRYPHQLSGGQQQRVCIANAIACDPDLVVLDEPTTGLDVTTQEQIIALLISLRARLGTAMLYVTHDLGLLAQIADRVGVMYAGYLVETAPADVLFSAPRHPYTQGLIASVPRIEERDGTVGRPLRGMLRRSELPPGCAFAPRCDHALDSCLSAAQHLVATGGGHEVACWRWQDLKIEAPPKEGAATAGVRSAGKVPLLEVSGLSLDYGRSMGLLSGLFPSKRFRAVDDVSFSIEPGETFALVGESGSGKSTIARGVSGLLSPAAGAIKLGGVRLAALVRERTANERRRIQYIFQNPDASLNPRTKVKTILARPLEMLGELDARRIRERVAAALADVRLDAAYTERYPDELSGGERQRVAIARALISDPDLVLCDEVLSALDVSVQASILDLLRRLKREKSLTMLFISHDLAVVRSIADRVGVMFRGRLMEVGPSNAVFTPPYHPYALSLINAVPRIETVGRRPLSSVLATPAEPIAGAACAYAGRCAVQLGETCVRTIPPTRTSEQGVGIVCHKTLAELAFTSPGHAAQNEAPGLTEP